MIEAVIELQRNMMDVEALARESHVNPFQTGREASLELFTEDVEEGTIMKTSALLSVISRWNSERHFLISKSF